MYGLIDVLRNETGPQFLDNYNRAEKDSDGASEVMNGSLHRDHSRGILGICSGYR